MRKKVAGGKERGEKLGIGFATFRLWRGRRAIADSRKVKKAVTQEKSNQKKRERCLTKLRWFPAINHARKKGPSHQSKGWTASGGKKGGGTVLLKKGGRRKNPMPATERKSQ